MWFLEKLLFNKASNLVPNAWKMDEELLEQYVSLTNYLQRVLYVAHVGI